MKDINLPLYSALMKHICVWFWAPQQKRDMELLEQVQQKAMRMTRGLEYLSYEDSLRDLGLFSLKKKQVIGGYISICRYQKRMVRLCLVVLSNRTRGRGQKLIHRNI